MTRRDPTPHLPLKPIDVHLLLVLSEGDLHGYGLVKEIEARSDGRIRLEPGNLYRYIRRLEGEGMVEPAGRRPNAPGSEERRRYYRVTDFGRRVLAAESTRMRALADRVDATLERA